MARKVRAILDAGGLKDVIILVSGGINEDVLQNMMMKQARRSTASASASISPPRSTCRRSIAPTSCRNMPASRSANCPKARRPGPAASKCGALSTPTAACAAISCRWRPTSSRASSLIVPVMRGGKRAWPRADAGANPRARGARSCAACRSRCGGWSRSDYPVKVADALKATLGRREAQTAPPSGANARRRPRSVPAARALAVNLVAVVGDDHGVLQLDEAARRMHQRGLHRDHLAGFERHVGIGRRIRHRPVIGEPRRLVADQPHAVGEEFELIVVLRFSSGSGSAAA